MSGSPFDLPQIVLPKVKLQDVLQVLRERLNKSYMPSASGEVQYNSKPYYYSKSYYGMGDYHAEPLADFPTFPNPIYFNTEFEIASFDNDGLQRTLFALICDDRVELLINLASCDTLVRFIGNGINGGPWMRWLEESTQEIALDLAAIKKRAEESL